MKNNDIFKKLRVALMLRDDQIEDILKLVDFRMSKAEIGNFFRNADHPKYVECGDQVLRNFLNGLVIHLRGTKEAPKNPTVVIASHKTDIKPKQIPNKTAPKPYKKPFVKSGDKPKSENPSKPAFNKNTPTKKPTKPTPIVERVVFKNGKK